MNASHILDVLEMIDDQFILQAKDASKKSARDPHKKVRNLRRTFVLAAIIAAVLSFCGFVAYEFGWFDPWIQRPSTDPTQTVRSAIENQLEKEYTWNIRIEEIEIDKAETERVKAMYLSSELAALRGWTDESLAEHFVVVRAKYYAEYDHTKTFIGDGYTQQYFYLIQDKTTAKWIIVDNTSPNTHNKT